MNNPKIPYAGFLVRFFAYLLENALAIFIPFVLLYVYFRPAFTVLMEIYDDTPGWLVPIVHSVYFFLINLYFLIRYETTLGKFILNLKIRSQDNKKMSLKQIVDRELIAKQLSGLPYWIGYLIAAFRKDKTALHDILAKTIVVQTNRAPLDVKSSLSPSNKSILIQIFLVIAIEKVSFDFKKTSDPKEDSVYSLKNVVPAQDDNFSGNNEERMAKYPPQKKEDDLKELLQNIKNGSRNFEVKDQEYLKEEEVQLAVIKWQPIMLMSWPKSIPLTSKALKEAAETIYKFDYFLPEHMKRLQEVKAASEENQERYKLHFLSYIRESLDENRRREPVRPIHPDFFNDKDLATIALTECFIIKEGFTYLKDAAYSDEAIHHMKQIPLDYFQASKINCFPEPLVKDNDFLVRLAEAATQPQDIESIMQLSQDPRLMKVKVKKTFSMFRGPRLLNNPSDIALAALDVQNDASFQLQIFNSYPLTIKYMNEKVVFDPNVLENFLKEQYHPERFFSEFQKSLPQTKALLEKHKNNTPEFLAAFEKRFIETYGKPQYSGDDLSKLNHAILSLPDELMKKDSFHIEVLRRTQFERAYLETMARVREIGPAIKTFMIESCRENNRFQSFTFSSDFVPPFLRGDEIFVTSLKKACQEGMEKRKVEIRNRNIPAVSHEKALEKSKAQYNASMAEIEARKKELMRKSRALGKTKFNDN